MTTHAEVDAGSCGFVTRMSVERHGRRVEIHITSDCEKVAKFAEALKSIDWADALTQMCDSVVYHAATRARLHPSCAVPAALLRAVEIETGAATPKEVKMRFAKSRAHGADK